MEVAIVLLATAIGVVGLVVTALVAGRLMTQRPRTRMSLGALSRRGLAWLALGLSATALFIYLHVSPLIPLPLVILGLG